MSTYESVGGSSSGSREDQALVVAPPLHLLQGGGVGVHPLRPGSSLHLGSSRPLKLFYTIPLAFNLPSTPSPEKSSAMHNTQPHRACHTTGMWGHHPWVAQPGTRGPTAALTLVEAECHRLQQLSGICPRTQGGANPPATPGGRDPEVLTTSAHINRHWQGTPGREGLLPVALEFLHPRMGELVLTPPPPSSS